jgi:KamA family protein
VWSGDAAAPRLQVYTERHLEQIPGLARLDAERRFAMRVVAQVLPFRVNQYVLDELIDWERVPDDPIFQLVFPQPGMLDTAHYERVAALLRRDAPPQELAQAVAAIRADLNPHPAQQHLNMPILEGERLRGMQHKYRETVLFFPSQGQTCHSYCTFCFRWAQFVGDEQMRFASREAEHLQRYLAAHHEVSDVLITGGDPLVMRTRHLAGYLLPLLEPRYEHIRTVRIGTKALSYWPYRILNEPDSDELLRLLETLVKGGKHVAVMAHVNHWRELETPAAREAIRRLRDTGAVLRTQSPLVAHINDDPGVWTRLWSTQVQLGMVPYYMFVERDTGARRYFEVPLQRAWQIYRDAVSRVSGLARTVRGPSMSAAPGKVEVQGVAVVRGEQVFVLRFLQARNPDWVQRPFFARYDARATWLDQLRPAFGARRFFFEEGEEAAPCVKLEDG